MTIKMVLSISISVILLGSIVGIVLNSNEKLSENNLRIAYFPNIGHAIPIVGMEILVTTQLIHLQPLAPMLPSWR